MTRQTTQPLREYRSTVISGVAYEIVNSMRPFLILDPPYQRGAVWTLDQRIALVRSWLMGTPIQGIVLNDRARTTWKGESPDSGSIAVVDGKQRVMTAAAWFDGELAVPATWFTPEWLTDEFVQTEDGLYVTHKHLSRPGRTMAKMNFKLPRIEATLATVEEEAELYLLVNGGGTPQTAADMANAAKVARR